MAEAEEEAAGFYPGFFWVASSEAGEGLADSVVEAALAVDSEALGVAVSVEEEQAEVIRSFDSLTNLEHING